MARFGSTQQSNTLTKFTHEKYFHWFLPFFCNFSICHSAFFLHSCSDSFNALKWHNSQSVFRILLKITIRASERSNWSFYGENRFHLFTFHFVFLSCLCRFCCHIVNVLFSCFHLSTLFLSLCVFFPFSFSFSFQGLLCADSSCKTYILNDFTWNVHEEGKNQYHTGNVVFVSSFSFPFISFHSNFISTSLHPHEKEKERELKIVPILKFQRNRISLEIPMVRLRMKIIEPFRLNLYILFVKISIGCNKQIRKLNIDPYLFSRVSSLFIGKHDVGEEKNAWSQYSFFHQQGKRNEMKRNIWYIQTHTHTSDSLSLFLNPAILWFAFKQIINRHFTIENKLCIRI